MVGGYRITPRTPDTAEGHCPFHRHGRVCDFSMDPHQLSERRLYIALPISLATYVVDVTQRKKATGLYQGNHNASAPSPRPAAPTPPLPHALHRLNPVRHALGLFCVWPGPPVLLLLLLRLAASAVGLVRPQKKKADDRFETKRVRVLERGINEDWAMAVVRVGYCGIGTKLQVKIFLDAASEEKARKARHLTYSEFYAGELTSSETIAPCVSRNHTPTIQDSAIVTNLRRNRPTKVHASRQTPQQTQKKNSPLAQNPWEDLPLRFRAPPPPPLAQRGTG